MDLAPQARLTTGRVLVAVCAVLVFVADRLTKGMVNAQIDPGTEVRVLPFLWLDNAHNSGAAFGIGQSGTLIFLVASAAVAAALVYYVLRYPQSVFVSVLLGLVLGGTVGNGYDRLVHGTVTDFIALHWWPVFNVADSAISAGVVGLLAVYLLRRRREG